MTRGPVIFIFQRERQPTLENMVMWGVGGIGRTEWSFALEARCIYKRRCKVLALPCVSH